MMHSSVSERWQQHQTDRVNSYDNIARVTRMPYTDPHGGYGWYTGEVNSSMGDPNGIGTMNYANGDVVYEGLWRNVVNVSDDLYALEPTERLSTRLEHDPSLPWTFQQGKRSHLATLNKDGETNDYNKNYTKSPSRADRSNITEESLWLYVECDGPTAMAIWDHILVR